MSATPARPIRFATFNVALARSQPGELLADLATPAHPQIRNIAEIIQRSRPDVLLVNEFDYVAGGAAVERFQANYLAVSQHGAEPIHFPHAFLAPTNTGEPSGFDLNRDGVVGGPEDALGFGAFPGQYGMVVLSRYPIRLAQARTFQRFLWKDMPGARLPDDPATGAPGGWYAPEALAVLRLSSKSHWDVPIAIGRRLVHLLASHPTPPAFEGPETRNTCRNHDEIRFWADYLTPGAGHYLYDDNGRRGGLRPEALFVIAGDLNSDPFDGGQAPGAVRQLLEHPLINGGLSPGSLGGAEQAARLGGAIAAHRGDPAHDTANFDPAGPGNLRVDYVLPRINLPISSAGVFWPTSDDPLFRLVGREPGPSSDHRLVWVDVSVPRGRPVRRA